MRQPDIKKSVPTWGTADGRQIPITELDDQHLSNVYWHSTIQWGSPHFRITDEVNRRFKGKPLPFKPLTDVYIGEITDLKKRGMIQGTDIVLHGTVIGSVKHLDKAKYTII